MMRCVGWTKTLLRHMLCAAVLLALWLFPTSASGEGSVRALFVACENFLSAESIAPSAGNNLRLLTSAFAKSVAPSDLRVENGTIASSAALGEAIAQAFAGAQEDDVSLLYLSTHGLYDASRPDEPARLLLSNGVAEDSITAAQLAEYLDGVPGTKVIILDACNSGAFIGKGMPVSVVRSMSLPLNRAGYKVIASSGGYEDAFYWNAGGYGAQGSSYFALALYHALTPQGGQYEADQNRDGAITLEELSDYLLRANGTSSVQCYPEQDDFVLFSYDVQAVPDTSTAAIAYFSLGNSILTYDDPTLTFSFTALRDARISYQIVYHQQGRWMWESAQRILDTSESADGMVRAGRKERALSLSVDSLASDVAGYALLQVIAESGAGTEVAESRLISVQPIVGNPQLSLAAPLSLTLGEERELVIEAFHDFPVSLTLDVYTALGVHVRSLARSVPSRPNALTPEASLFYWDGRDDEGEYVLPGQYALRLSTTVGGRQYGAVFEYVYVREGTVMMPVQPIG